jgi:murein hydrolase activator
MLAIQMNVARNVSSRCLCAAAAFAALWCSGVWAAAATDSEQAQAKLAAVRARIAALTNRLGDELKERDALSSRLRAAELVITAKRRRMETLRVEKIAAERRRTELRGEQAATQNALQAERAALGEEVRAAYMIGRQEELKLLLNQSNPASLGRTLAYYGYFAQQRGSKIEFIQGRELKLQQLVAEIDQQSAQLRALEGEASSEMAAVENARAERAEALAAISKQLANGNQELANLKREEQAVQSLVDELARVLQDFPIDATQSFDRMRGKLPWPVLGRVTAHYSHGEMIAAARGAKVRAAFFGRVVYADWLQGLGLLLIIGHGGGYMTLYGHAEVLYKSVGDWVAPGDVIAALSDAGGAAPQLYFEIRQGRKTVDPQVWLKTRP